MIADILARLTLGVSLHPEAEFLVKLHQLLSWETVKYLFIIRMDIVHESLQIWRAPLAVQIGITKPQLPLTQQPLEYSIVVDPKLADRPRTRTFRPKDAAILKNKVYAPILSFLRNAESRGKITWQIFLPVGGAQDHIGVSRIDWNFW